MADTKALWEKVLFRIGDLHKTRDELDITIKELTQLNFDAQCEIAGVKPGKKDNIRGAKILTGVSASRKE